jgi:hypothetical protein
MRNARGRGKDRTFVPTGQLPSLLTLWSYTTKAGLTVFTDLVDLTVVTVAIPYLFSAGAQLTYLNLHGR